ncbi:DeoR family transcriptional regulator [Candidatus Dojkabacteria bacterium]|nr:DeoR family transcriptional regulator [Candidatus Dojkabacteria bacterium]
MYEPSFKLTHNMLNNIVRFEVERKGILDLHLDDEVVSRIRLSTNANDIFHLGNLFGVGITLKIARKIASGKTLSLGDYRGNYLTNFRNAMEYILATQTSYYPVQGNILIHLNKILIKGVAEEWDAKYRTSGEEIEKKDDNWLSSRSEEIASVEVQSQALQILEWFESNSNKIHSLIRIPAVIYRLVKIAPFVTGNQLTILAAAKYLFFKSGMFINGYLPIIKNFDVYGDEYIEAWRQASGGNDDITLWIERFIRNFADESVALRERIDRVIEDDKEKNKQPFLNLNRRQLKILRYLQNIPQVKREEYVEMMSVSTMTAYRDLNELVRKGLLQVEGQGRGTSYMLASR